MSELVSVDATLVRYLYAGVRTQFGFAAEWLAKSLLECGEVAASYEYDRSFALVIAAHGLYTELTDAISSPEADFEVNLKENGLLVLAALECQYIAEIDQRKIKHGTVRSRPGVVRTRVRSAI